MQTLIDVIDSTAEGGVLQERERRTLLSKPFAAARTLLEKAIRSQIFVVALEVYLADFDDTHINVVGIFGAAPVRAALRPIEH